MSEGINEKKEDLGIKINTLEVDYEIEKKKIFTKKTSDSEYTFRTGNQADNKSKYLVSIYAKDFSFKGYLSNTLTKEKIGLFNYGNSEDADCYCGNWENDEKNGEGLYFYPVTNDIYIGNWIHNKKEGTGLYFSNANNIVTNFLGTFNNDNFKEGLIVSYQVDKLQIIPKFVYKGKVDENGIKNDDKGIFIEKNIILKGKVVNDEKIEGVVIVFEEGKVKYSFKMNKVEGSGEDYNFSINEDKETEQELIETKKRWDESNLIDKMEQYCQMIMENLAEANGLFDNFQTAIKDDNLQHKISQFNELVNNNI